MTPAKHIVVTLMSVVAVGCVVWAVAATARGLFEVRTAVLAALWTLWIIIPLHLLQLYLSGAAWHALLPQRLPGLVTCFALRTIREGINSLLPVARVGGEVVAASLLAARGMDPAEAAASITVDVTIELITQLVFLLAGLVGLAELAPDRRVWTQSISAVTAGLVAAALLLLSLRFGLLRLIERLVRALAQRWPHLRSLDGLEAAASGIARHLARLLRAGGLHMGTWILGSVESWLILRALGHPVGPGQALVIESLGVAARSAGFALPGAVGVQEGGFILVCAAFGVPDTAGLALSLIKRAREVVIGLLGIALWRVGRSRWYMGPDPRAGTAPS
jgi:putative membrane protein